MTVFFTSDTHFSHAKIIEYANRPFANVDDMNAALIRNWNTTVGKTDTVYFLGDFAFGTQQSGIGILNSLHGDIHLIIGNHDRPTICASPRWSSVQPYKEINHNGRLICMFHYPIASWKNVGHGSYHFHGHSHGNYPGNRQMLDVGVDLHGYKPITFEQAEAAMVLTPLRAMIDHH